MRTGTPRIEPCPSRKLPRLVGAIVALGLIAGVIALASLSAPGVSPAGSSSRSDTRAAELGDTAFFDG